MPDDSDTDGPTKANVHSPRVKKNHKLVEGVGKHKDDLENPRPKK